MVTAYGNYYAGKKVLVTGHTGFKGSWLSTWLNMMGAKVYGIALEPATDPSMFQAVGLENSTSHHVLDIRNKAELSSLVKKIQPDVVLHMAAQALVFAAYDDPISTIETNAIGTANVLESLRQIDHPCSAVMITSDKCYENVEWEWGYRESDRLGGADPYSASKACAEIVISSYVRSFFNNDSKVRIASVRAGNVIGGGDWSANRIVPDCVKSWSDGKSVLIRRPNSTRPWQHVLEPLSGYLRVGELLSSDEKLHGESFNIGPPANQDHSVLELITRLSNHWFGDSPAFDPINLQPDQSRHEAGLLKLSCDKALARLGWEPTYNFEQTTEATASWYKAYYAGSEDIQKLTVQQIRQYVDCAFAKGSKWTQN
ncbi:MAG: CDP-glucose 4,6-dehydratase [Pirellulales bacterium]